MNPQPGEIYVHFKDTTKRYRIEGTAMHTETEEQMVVYRPLYEGAVAELFVRPLDLFTGEVDKPEIPYQGPRFMRIDA